MPATTGFYPYDIQDDGTATCYNCGGDGYADKSSGFVSCTTCRGDGFVSAAQVARFILNSVEFEEDQRRRRGHADAIDRLQSFLDQLPAGHQDRAGVIRSIEVLGGRPRLTREQEPF